MKYLILLSCIFLCGCAGSDATIKKTIEGFVIEANRPCYLKYEVDEDRCEYDSRSQPLINIGDVPDFNAVKKD